MDMADWSGSFFFERWMRAERAHLSIHSSAAPLCSEPPDEAVIKEVPDG